MPALCPTASPGPATAGRTAISPYVVMVIRSMAPPMIVSTVIVVIGYAETGLTGTGLLMSLFCAAYIRSSPLFKHAGATGTSAW